MVMKLPNSPTDFTPAQVAFLAAHNIAVTPVGTRTYRDAGIVLENPASRYYIKRTYLNDAGVDVFRWNGEGSVAYRVQHNTTLKAALKTVINWQAQA